MVNEATKKIFLDAAEAWVCDDYSFDIRFMAEVNNGRAWIWYASVYLNPLPAVQDLSFQIEGANFIIGQAQNIKKKEFLIALLKDSINGVLSISSKDLVLPTDNAFRLNSEMNYRERWFSDLHIQVVGDSRPALLPSVLAEIDNELRAHQLPFDGLGEVATWLGLPVPAASSSLPYIEIRINPPVDLIFGESSLIDDKFRLTLLAHPKFDVTTIGLAVRGAPGNGLDSRKQVSDKIKWGRVRKGVKKGVAKIQLRNTDSVLAILRIGNSTVRRHWFIDPKKARNNRLLAMQHFDKDLRMVKSAVLESTDSVKFEQGVAALLFLLGFSPAVQIETNAPDLVVMTPAGRLAIIECTIRTADFSSKLGKLVDRRGALLKSLAASGHKTPVYAVLVCRLPRDQIAAYNDAVRAHGVILAAGEDLAAGFDKVRFPNDPDSLLEEAHNRVVSGIRD